MTDETPPPEFNPDDYPQTFTPAFVRKMTLREIITIEQNIDRLSEEQQRSFHEARAVVLGPALAAIKDLSSSVPTFRLPPEVLKSFNTVTADIARQARMAAQIQTGFSRGYRGDATVEAPPATATAGAPAPSVSAIEDDAALEDATVEEFGRDVDRLTQLYAVVQDIARLLEADQLRTTRGKFFAGLVSMAVIVAGVAPLVAAQDWCERLWIIGISVCLGLTAYAVYRFTLREPKAKST